MNLFQHALSAVAVALSTISFAETFGPEIIASGNGPAGVLDAVVADLNRDGIPDVVTASTFDDRFAWHENLFGSGQDWVTRTIAGPPQDPSSVAAADLDNDGDMDVIGASAGDGNISWFENLDSKGLNWTRHAIATGAAGVARIVVGDLQGDGRPDVVAALRFGNTVAWYQHPGGDGTGTWAMRTIASDMAAASSVLLGDFDHDNRTDVAATAFDSDTVRVWRNVNGTGQGWSLSTVATDVNGAAGLAAADFDKDGDLDLAVCANFDANLTWFENTAGNGTAWTRRPGGTGLSNAAYIVAGDFDHDGNTDLAAAAVGDDSFSWFKNPANKTQGWTRRSISNAADGASCLALFPGATAPSLVGGAFSAGQIALYHNPLGPGAWTESIIAGRSQGAQGVAAGDLDNDAREDIVVASFKDNKIAWLQSRDFDGTRWFERVLTRGALGAASVAVGDLDGDLRKDVAACSFNDDTLRWFRNDGGGEHFTSHTLATDLDGASKVIITDLSGDQRPDLVCASRNDNKLTWFQNVNATTWTARTISTALAEVDSVAAGDVDGDGHVDLVAAAFASDKLVLFRNTGGQGLAWDASDLATGQDGAAEVVIADLDKDGDNDVAVTNYNGDQLGWFDNRNGNATLWVPYVLGNGLTQASALMARDVDLDGRVDLLMGAFGLNLLTWYRNTAPGAYTVENLGLNFPGPTSAALGDFDHDGDPDLAAALYHGDRVSVFLNATRTNNSARGWFGYQ